MYTVSYSSNKRFCWHHILLSTVLNVKPLAINSKRTRFKLMNNAVCVMNCERRRSKLTIAREADQVLSAISKFEFDPFMIFRKKLCTRKVYWNNPTTIGATIFVLAKYQMYSFYYYTTHAHFVVVFYIVTRTVTI